MADLTPKTINELTEATSLSDADLFAVSHSSASRRITWGNLKKSFPVNFDRGSISGGASTSFSLADYARGVIICSSAAASKQDVIVYYARQGAAVAFTRLANATDLTVTAGTNTLTISPASGAQVIYLQLTW
jgi:hypothetical protein